MPHIDYSDMVRAIQSNDRLFKDYVLANIDSKLVSILIELAINIRDEYIVSRLLTNKNIIEHMEEIMDKFPEEFIRATITQFNSVLVRNIYMMRNIDDLNFTFQILMQSHDLDDDITEFLIGLDPQQVRQVLETHSYLNPTEYALNIAKPDILDVFLDYVKIPTIFYFELMQNLDDDLINKILRSVYLDGIPLPEKLIKEKLRIRQLLQEIAISQEEYKSYDNIEKTFENSHGLSNEGHTILSVILGTSLGRLNLAERELKRIGHKNFDY